MHCLEHKQKPDIEGLKWSFSNNWSRVKSQTPGSFHLSKVLVLEVSGPELPPMKCKKFHDYTGMSLLSHSQKEKRVPGGKFHLGSLFLCSQNVCLEPECLPRTWLQNSKFGENVTSTRKPPQILSIIKYFLCYTPREPWMSSIMVFNSIFSTT